MDAIDASAADAEWALQEVYLQVSVNQVAKPSLYRFVVLDERLHASPATLRELGLLTPASPQQSLLPVERDGIVATYDTGLQRVAITAPLAAMTAATTRLGLEPPQLAPSPTPPGLLLNYQLDAYRTGSSSNVVLAPYARLFGVGPVTLESSGIVRAHSSAYGRKRQAIRLDSRLRWTSQARALELIVGDFTSGGADWTRQTRLGGVRFGTNYGELQPYRSLSPGPMFSGESALPSSVELYVNGIRQYEAQTPPGQFVVSGAPSMEGLGNAQLVITDAFGRVRTVDIPFYGTQRLLVPGLDDWSLSLGHVRLGYGAESWHYHDDNALVANWRRGLTRQFTAEVHAEATRGLRMAGLGGAALLGPAGVVHAAWSRSDAAGLTGNQRAWGYQWSNGLFSVMANSVRGDAHYRDLAAVTTGILPARASDSASVGLSSPLLGNLNLTYANLEYHGQDRSRLAGLYWSRLMGGRWYVNIGGNVDLHDSTRTSLNLGLSMALDNRRHASANVQRTPDRTQFTAGVNKQVQADGDVGWRLQARHDSPGNSGGLAEVTWLTPFMQIGGGIAREGSDTQLHAMASGSVLWTGRSVFPAREVISGFVLVDVGRPGVPVKLENRPYGVSNRMGQLLVTPAFPFQRNRVSIDPTDLPADIRLLVKDKDAVPGASGAARIAFDVAEVRAAIVTLLDSSGNPLPLGSSVRRTGLAGIGDGDMVGYDGEVYLEDLAAANVLDVTVPDGVRCIARFDYPADAAAIPRIGPVTCELERQP